MSTARAATRRRVAVLGVGAYVALGLPGGALGVVWPSMRESFAQPLAALGPVLALFTAGYLLAAIAHGRVAERIPTGVLLATSASLGTAALLLFAATPVWALALVASAVQGVAAAGIDAELNAYVAVHHSARLLQVMHGGFGLGATVGPVLVAGVLELGWSWRVVYVAMGAWWLGGALAFAVTRSTWVEVPVTAVVPVAAGGIEAGPHTGPTEPDPPMTRRLALTVVAGLVTFFAYNGLEIAAGTWAFTALVAGGMADGPAALSVTGFWAALTAGRLGAGLAGHRAPPGRVLVVSMVAVPLAAALLLAGGAVASAGLLLLGGSLAGVFPALVALTPSRLGPARARRLMGLQFGSAVVGAAVVSAAVGVIAARAGERAIAPSLLAVALVLVGSDRCLAVLARRRALVPSPPPS